MNIRIILLLGLAFLIQSTLFAQRSRIDSLKIVLEKAVEDSNKVVLLNSLTKENYVASPEVALNYGIQSKQIAQKINFKRGYALALKYTGIAYFNMGRIVESLQQYEQSLQVFDEIGDKAGVANIYSNMGNVYYNQGDDVKALDLFLKSLTISENINDTLRTVTALINIGAVYTNKTATHSKALQFLLRALPLCEALKDSQALSVTTVNIGEMYLYKNYDDSALFYFEKSLKASKGTENVPYCLNFIGKVYTKKKEYEKAIQYQLEAYKIAKEYESKNDMTISLVELAKTYKENGDIMPALTTYSQAETLANEIGAKKSLKDIYEGLAQVYSNLPDYKNAFKYQNLLIGIKDTLYNIDTDKKLGTLQFTFDIEKKQGQINLLTKDQKIQQQEIRRQTLMRNGFIGGFAIVLLFAGVFFTQRNNISKEKKRSDELLLNILPSETAEELKSTGTAKTKSFDHVTVMFTDFKNFTQASEKLTPEELVSEINYCYSAFDEIVTRHGIEKIKTIGDSYMCAGGLPVKNSTHPQDVVQAGLEMQAFIEKNKKERIAIGQPYFELRLGVHTGPVVAGIVGIKKFAYDIWGDTVNTASRMESSGHVGEVNVSETTYELIKEKFICTHRGKIQAKNKGEIDMYFVHSLIL